MVKKDLKNSRQFKEAMSRQKRKSPDEFEYTNVPLTWCVRFDLSPTELFTYCIVRDRTISYEEHAYTGSIKGLCAILNVAIPTVRAALENLEKKGFIYKEIRNRARRDGQMSWVTYVAHRNLTRNGQSIEENLKVFALLNEQRKKNFS